MIDPQHATATDVADPEIPQQLLADIAAQRPDLRSAVAAHPAAYPALLEWLAALGDDDVDAALRARSSGSGDVASRIAQYGTLPERDQGAAPSSGAGHGASSAPGAGGFAPLGTVGGGTSPWPTSPAPASPVLPVPVHPAVPVTGPGPATGVTGGSASGHPTGAASPPTSPWAAAPYAHVGPGQAPWHTPPKKTSYKALWIALAVLAVLMAAAVGLMIMAFALASGAAYGDDEVLDGLYDGCAAGDMQACDDLYYDSPLGSEYEEFGGTCGGRTVGTEWLCTEADLG